MEVNLHFVLISDFFVSRILAFMFLQAFTPIVSLDIGRAAKAAFCIGIVGSLGWQGSLLHSSQPRAYSAGISFKGEDAGLKQLSTKCKTR